MTYGFDAFGFSAIGGTSEGGPVGPRSTSVSTVESSSTGSRIVRATSTTTTEVVASSAGRIVRRASASSISTFLASVIGEYVIRELASSTVSNQVSANSLATRFIRLGSTVVCVVNANSRAPIHTKIYDTTDDFLLWTGFRRVHQDTMRLAFTNMASVPGLNIQDRLFHYRWGTLQDHTNTPDDSLDAAPEGVVLITANGVKTISLSGLRGQYWNNRYLSGLPDMERNEAPIDLSWGGSPGSPIGDDDFSIRWTGFIYIPTTGTYYFGTQVDDGNRLWVDDVLIIDNWAAHSGSYIESSGMSLTGGTYVSVKYEYYEIFGGASAKLYWKGPPTGGSAVIIPAENLSAGLGVGSFLRLPHAAGDVQFLYEATESSPPVPPAPGGVRDSFVFATWVNLEASTGTRTLAGGHFATDPDTDPENQNSIASFQIAVTGTGETNESLLSCSIHIRDFGTSETSFYHEAVFVGSPGEHHLMLHQFFTRSEDEVWWHGRWFVDGLFLSESKARLDYGFAWYANIAQPAIRASMLSSKPPILLGTMRSIAPWDGIKVWGSEESVERFDNEVDETLLAYCHPLLDEDGDPIIDQDWEENEAVFPAHRHPSPALWGVEAPEFRMYSPVIRADHGVGTAIYKVRVDWNNPSPTSGQSVSIAVRAHDDPFSSDDEELPWSDWIVLDESDNGEEVEVFGGGFGAYVQMRIRLLPSNDTLNSVSPEVERVQWWAKYMDYTAVDIDLDATYYAPPYVDLDGTYVCFQTADIDLDATYTCVLEADPIDLDATYTCYIAVDIDLPATYNQFGVNVDLDATYTLVQLFAEVDLPATYTCPVSYVDLPATYFSPKSVDLPATYTALEFYLPATYTALRTGFKDLGATYTCPPEKPSGVAPITSTLPEAAWTSSYLVTFNWRRATFVHDPVLAYYWKLSRTSENADQTWSNRTSQTINLNLLSYGGGVWYFNVAARNTGGQFGPTAHYAVWFNNPPTTPGVAFMRVNGLDSLLNRPLVPATGTPILTWSPASDPDPDETITYRLQVARQADFGLDATTGQTSIQVDVALIANAVYTLAALPKYGVWYWRIRADDGKQIGNWSDIASFKLNTPPNRPTSLVISAV